MNKSSRLVYSTATGRVKQEKPTSESFSASADGSITIRRETKGRKGKGVTLISGFSMTGSELKTLAKALKNKCSTGGTVKQGVIEIQGDKRDIILSYLIGEGFKAKISGG